MIMEFESLIRKAVQEEMEQAKERVIGSVLQAFKLINLSRPSLDYHIETSQGIGYQLVFAGKLPSTIFTDSKIESEMGGPIKIELVDTISKAIVTSGPLSSMKIKIVVLDGDLGFEDQENWTEQQFDAKVVRGKKDKRPLVIGNLVIALKDGVGTLSDLSFTDNSSWIKCRKFRLSAKVEMSGQGRIKEAISNAFKVKEYRTKMYEKHYPPSLDDNVWRLEKIAKGGLYHTRLADHHIHKVKDFMQMYKNNPNKLKDVLNCPDRLWNTVVKHASTCVSDEKPNAVDGHNYQPPAKRSCIQEPLFESKNDQAFENMNIFYPVDGCAILGQSNDLTSLQAEPVSTPTTAFSGMHTGSYLASTSSSYKGGLEDHNHQLQLPVGKNSHLIQPSDPTCRDYNIRTCNEETVTNLAYGMTSQDPMSTCPSVSMQSSDPICGDYNIRMDGLLETEGNVPSLAYGMTSQPPTSTCPSVSMQSSDPICGDYNIRMDGLLETEGNVPSLAYGMTSQPPTSTCPSVTALWEHSSGLISNDSEPDFIPSLIKSPVHATSELDFFYSQIRSPGNEEIRPPFFPRYQWPGLKERNNVYHSLCNVFYSSSKTDGYL